MGYPVRSRITTLGLALLLTLTALTPTHASRGGTVTKSSTFVVGMTFRDGGVDQVCSGALIAPSIIATAAHCVVGAKGGRNTDFTFAAPGTSLDAPIDPRLTPPQIINIYKPDSYTTSAQSALDDIAFIELDRPLATKGFIRIATSSEILGLSAGTPLSGFGFGYVFETNAPYSPFPRKYPLTWRPSFSGSDLKKTLDLTSTTASGCSGDSGGPITASLPTGEEVLVGVLSGAASVANSCGQAGNDGQFHMLVTMINPYLGDIAPILNAALKPKPTPTPTKKIIKITCVKGKVKKVVSGTNPKCPKGYVKK